MFSPSQTYGIPHPVVWREGKLRKRPIWSGNKVGNGGDEAPLSAWISGGALGLSGNASIGTDTAGRSRACHRIAQGEELKLQLVLLFNERSYRTLETGQVLKQTGLVNAAEGLWQILGDDGD
ncbi:hypothetical protein M9458_014198, partial [Cirrhinus mrigala]